MKKLIFVAAGLLAVAAAAAQTAYPSKPIKFLVPFTAGSGTDLIARTVADTMSKSMGQTIIIENRPGAGGTI
ncbi:MAG: tripartite tricarboxylate transporter substrate-binding protein, partial [Polaromonas sp.]|nr:tripartite tricarboxylate transporter substrate-binding protein [Polaromonas sp.]